MRCACGDCVCAARADAAAMVAAAGRHGAALKALRDANVAGADDALERGA